MRLHFVPLLIAPAVRRVIHTTNAIESVNAQLRKIIKTRGHFPSDDAASKLIWLAIAADCNVQSSASWAAPWHYRRPLATMKEGT